MRDRTEWETFTVAVPLISSFLGWIFKNNDRIYGKPERFMDSIERLSDYNMNREMKDLYKTEYKKDINNFSQMKSMISTVHEAWFYQNSDLYKSTLDYFQKQLDFK